MSATGACFPVTGAQPFKGQTLHIFTTEVVSVISYKHHVPDPEYEKVKIMIDERLLGTALPFGATAVRPAADVSAGG
jgi:hypothetical protein